MRVRVFVGVNCDWLAFRSPRARAQHMSSDVADLALHTVELQPASNPAETNLDGNHSAKAPGLQRHPLVVAELHYGAHVAETHLLGSAVPHQHNQHNCNSRVKPHYTISALFRLY